MSTGLSERHHGNGAAPQLTRALARAVAVINNGQRKSPRLEDIWPSHRALDTEPAYRAADELTANLTAEDDCRGH